MLLLFLLGNFDVVYNKLKNASKTQNFTVYSKEEIAQVPNWFYSKNRRILDIIVVANLGYVFEDFADKIKYYDSHFNRTRKSSLKFLNLHLKIVLNQITCNSFM